ncbi:MAG TPA: PfkB family carbohydrate kinase [Thermoplasmata archaeon]|nr:PfkB family carbohydrate kinase [Thermoplasmata archaeon]
MTPSSADTPRDLAVSGHVNVDRFLRVARFPAADRTVPVTGTRTELGGTAANLARVAAARGVRVGVAARIGDDFPAEFRRRLVSAGVDVRELRSVPGRPTPTCFTIEDRSGEQRTLIDQGPMGDGPGPRPSRAWLRRYAWLHLGTGPPTLQLALARAARALGLRVAADPAQEIFYRWRAPDLRDLLDLSEVLFGNAAEIRCATDLVGVASPRALLDRVPLVVRTEGSRGATALSRVGAEHVPATRPRRVRSIVGAGDAFRGGFYGAFFRGAPLRRCLVEGGRAASGWIEGNRP